MIIVQGVCRLGLLVRSKHLRRRPSKEWKADSVEEHVKTLGFALQHHRKRETRKSHHIAEHVFLGKPEETEMLIPYVSLSIYLSAAVASAVK